MFVYPVSTALAHLAVDSFSFYLWERRTQRNFFIFHRTDTPVRFSLRRERLERPTGYRGGGPADSGF